MCGIFACLSKNAFLSLRLALDGINRLTNQGQDSFGLGTITGGRLMCHKATNPNGLLIADALAEYLKFYEQCNLLIAHVRQATRGSVTTANAHPHICWRQKIMLVHKGCIDNYDALKTFILKQNKTLILASETDSEIIVNLLSYFDSQGCEPIESINKTTSMLQGHWACVFLHVDYDQTIFAFRHDCPLFIGKTDDNEILCIASDVTAFSCQVSKYQELPSDKACTIRQD